MGLRSKSSSTSTLRLKGKRVGIQDHDPFGTFIVMSNDS